MRVAVAPQHFSGLGLHVGLILRRVRASRHLAYRACWLEQGKAPADASYLRLWDMFRLRTTQVPETKGKTLEQIEAELRAGAKTA